MSRICNVLFLFCNFISLCLSNEDIGECSNSKTNETSCCADYYRDSETKSCLPCVGSFGHDCSTPCQYGYFGHGCRRECDCNYSQTCDPMIGCIVTSGEISNLTDCLYMEKVYNILTRAYGINICYNSSTTKTIECCTGFTNRTGVCENRNAYLGLLQEKRTLLQKKNEVFILLCILMEKWTMRDYLSWLHPKAKFYIYAFITMPICSNHHWLLLVANVTEKTVSVLDPQGHQYSDIKFNLRMYIHKRKKYIPEGLEKWSSDHQALSFQRNDNSCGVFVVMIGLFET
ncbi:uncharacterized protein [Magallana gigas]|uniref:uncharacterized protein isoform X3 n=1 Tax=Magallana gigas TaxID=29159 RepID=UPI00334276F9